MTIFPPGPPPTKVRLTLNEGGVVADWFCIWEGGRERLGYEECQLPTQAPAAPLAMVAPSLKYLIP